MPIAAIMLLRFLSVSSLSVRDFRSSAESVSWSQVVRRMIINLRAAKDDSGEDRISNHCVD
jgi:hypothetical protein